MKKRMAMFLYQRTALEQAAALIATSEMEAENFRRLNLTAPIALVPNGVEMTADVFYNRNESQASELCTILFLSRIHPKKGLIELVRAWAEVRPRGWRLMIAGPDESNHWSDVAKLIHELRLESEIEYYGPVEGESKANLYRQADLFVLPTYSENFGLVVAEALSYGVPVITTRGAPWGDLETYRCGWWINVGTPALADALRAAFALSDAERRAMGQRGREYVRRYNWDFLAKQTLELYRWVLGKADRPAFVRVD